MNFQSRGGRGEASPNHSYLGPNTAAMRQRRQQEIARESGSGAGISELGLGWSPSPVVGLSHLARGEAVIPNAAMRADPSLRQRAMQSMASRGRNPSQFTVGQQNLRNPSTGMPMFADLVYRDGQYVDASTGQAANFSSGGGGFADLGTNMPSSPSAPGYSPAGIDGAAIARSLGLNPSVAQGVGTPEEIDRFIQATQNFTRQVVAPARQQEYWSDPNQAVDFAPGGRRLTVADMGPDWQSSGFKAAGIDAALPVPGASSPTFGIPDSDVGTPEAAANYGFGNQSAPQTYDQWRQTRNPSGKNMPNTLFGQTQTAGSDGGFSTGGMQMPNVLAGQMPVAGPSWGTPGTVGGMARENTANDPSILRSGYNDLSLSPSIYSGAFGASGMVGQQSGIAFSGQNPMSPGQSNQQKQYGGGFGFNSAFRY